MTLALLCLALLACVRPSGPRFYWNASPSVALGLYLRMAGVPSIGALVLARLPPPYLELADARGYLPVGVPLIKEVGGAAGDLVCRHGMLLTLNGRLRAVARDADARGRTLPVWRGCRHLRRGEIFLLSRMPGAFDSRYFGPLMPERLMGTAVPIVILPRAD
jgi:type IV secretory pathway protease TraF